MEEMEFKSLVEWFAERMVIEIVAKEIRNMFSDEDWEEHNKEIWQQLKAQYLGFA